MSDLHIIKNFCNNNINDLDRLSSEAKKILFNQSLKVLNNKNNQSDLKYLNFRKKAVEILNILNDNNFCIFKYKLISEDVPDLTPIGITLMVEKNNINYYMIIKKHNDLYDRIFHLYKTKELPNLNGYSDFCEITHKQLLQYKDLNNIKSYDKDDFKKSFLNWIEHQSSHRSLTILIREITEHIEINSLNFTDDNLFQIFYYYFICFYNNFLNIPLYKLSSYFVKYNKKITYSI